jgi:hypothetical protein
MKDDELMLLWRQGVSAEPRAEEIERLAGRASVRRFDRMIFLRNSREYAAGIVGAIFFGWLITKGDKPYDRVQGLTGFLCVGASLGYLWWQHRDLIPLDTSADGRTYRAAMLGRIDKQIRLLATVRYWGLPVYLWLFASGIVYGGLLDLAALTALYMVIVWLNEKWAVRWLRAERAKIEALYEQA